MQNIIKLFIRFNDWNPSLPRWAHGFVAFIGMALISGTLDVILYGNSHPEANQMPTDWRIIAILVDLVIAILFLMIFARLRSDEIMQFKATHDTLTGLPNRDMMMRELELAKKRSDISGRPAAIMFIDLNDFKQVNDSLGHGAGDELLRAVSKQFLSCVRDTDTVARIGGDEFLVILPDMASLNDAIKVADLLTASLASPISLGGIDIFTSASIGIAIYPRHGANAAELLQNADAAMYRAKKGGKTSYAFYDADMNVHAKASMKMESDLHLALDAGEIFVHYQPQFDVREMKIVGVEALVRWRHDGALVSPDKFIPIAERSGMIVEIGRFVLDTACTQGALWQKMGFDLSVSVNVSMRQAEMDDLVNLVALTLLSTRLSSDRLELEITESMMVSEGGASSVDDLFLKMHGIGVKMSIDDFGTGYSSFARLKGLPIDKLKIDRSFVQSIDANDDDAAIVHAIIALSRSLHIDVIAEGVETVAQQAVLVASGCYLTQGYLHGKPMSAEDVTRLLVERGTPQPVDQRWTKDLEEAEQG